MIKYNPQHDLLLEEFKNINWHEERQQLKTSPLNKFPFLPLDIKIPTADRKIIFEQLKEQNKKMNEIPLFGPDYQPGANKIWFYGMRTGTDWIKDYKEWYKISSDTDIQDIDHLDRIMSKYDYEWKIECPELKTFRDSFPKKKLYSVEGGNYQPDGKAYVHHDREKFNRVSGDLLYGRIYIPIEWEDSASLYWYGFGKVPIESGRVYVLNTRQIHGSHNQSTEHRYAVHFAINPKTNKFEDLLKSSKQNFLKTF